MPLKRTLAVCFVALACLFATGCFTVEQEIFLNPDGSGEFVMYISIPDFPDEMMKNAPGDKGNPADILQKFKTELTGKLPPTLKLKEVREARQNGARGFYAIFQFKDFKDVESVLKNFGQESLKDGETPASPPPQWTMQLEKRGAATFYTQKFLMDLPPAKKKTAPAQKSPADPKQADEPAPPVMEDLEKQLTVLVFSMIKLRFVLHAPAPIKESNADIVLNGNTAVWNVSFAAFANAKDQQPKPVEMKAVF